MPENGVTGPLKWHPSGKNQLFGTWFHWLWSGYQDYSPACISTPFIHAYWEQQDPQ
jgi:hypothetical protein